MSSMWSAALSQATSAAIPAPTPLLWLALATAGGLGAVARRQSDLLLMRLEATRTRRIPTRTMLINIVACFALGLLTGATLSHELLAVLGTGFLGGYSTFSTAMVESARLLSEPQAARSCVPRALLHCLGMLSLSLLAALLGLSLGRLLAHP